MQSLLGEYKCKVDAKGRVMLPAKLRKDLEEIIHHGLILNRDIFENCLVLYPNNEWDRVISELQKLSRYKKKHQKFLRRFLMGATRVELDSAGRFLIPSLLLEFAQINPKEENEIVVSGMNSRIEIWSLSNHKNQIADEEDDFGDLAEDIGRDIDNNNIIPLN